MDALPGALAALAASGQFVTWYAIPSDTKPGKVDKIPCLWHTGLPCNAHDPANWTTADVALATHKLADKGYGSGVGFVFTNADPYFFHDLDSALEPDGQWSALAQQQCARFPGAAVEVSHSGRGLHIIGTLTGPPPPHGTRNVSLHMELYTSGRFVALTGINAIGDVRTDCTAAFAATAAQYFPPSAVTVTPGQWTTAPVPEWSGPTDDDELIRRALAAAARSPAGAFGGKLTFADLWRGDVPDVGRSENDQTLANHLAFWTGKDCERIERLMRKSGMAREKWDSPSHAGYLSTTILKACGFVTKVASDDRSGKSDKLKTADMAALITQAQTAAGLGAGEASQRDITREIISPYDQLDHFAGCTFISDHLKIYSLPRNKLMVREAFEVDYGGHVFVVDGRGEKTTDSAYAAFTRSRVNKPAIVDDLCFRPELAPGEIVRQGTWSAVNTYVPYECVTAPGDPTPFLNHLSLMIPDAADRAVLLEYMAHLAQRPGVKVQWWPVVQGTKGNGKTLLIRILSYIAGESYTHLPNAEALAKDGMKFNGWILRKTFVGFEEMALSDRRGFMEELKPVVTNDRLPVEKKGIDQITGDNRANGFICTNHKDGVPIDDDERRYAVFFTAQQKKADLAAAGMTGDYFPNLYDWLYGRGRYAGQAAGLAILAHYLKTYPLPRELPANAPETSSTREAVRVSLGRAEQEIIEAIEAGAPGFCGGWVSSLYLDRLLEGIKARVPRNKRRAMMQALGYDTHPALPGGRVPAVVTPDNNKPVLYLKLGHTAFALQGPVDIGNAYSRAQGAEAAQKAFGAVNN